MSSEVSILAQLIKRSFTEPRQVAEELLARDFTRNSLWMFLVLVSVFSALVLSAVSAVTPKSDDIQTIVLSPWMAAGFVGVVMTALVFSLFYVGQWMGGDGDLDGTILMVSWHQAVTVAFQLAQLVVVLFSPSLGALMNLVGIIFLFYVLLQFIDVLHGYGSLAKSFGAFAFAMVGMFMAMAILLSLFGFDSVSTL